jgi:hypothetical protein
LQQILRHRSLALPFDRDQIPQVDGLGDEKLLASAGQPFADFAFETSVPARLGLEPVTVPLPREGVDPP